MVKILDRLKNRNKPSENGNQKPAHIVEMKDDNKPGAVANVNISKGTKVKDLKIQLGYEPQDDLIRGKDRQTLNNETDIFSLIEPDEKLIVCPNTEMGNGCDNLSHPIFFSRYTNLSENEFDFKNSILVEPINPITIEPIVPITIQPLNRITITHSQSILDSPPEPTFTTVRQELKEWGWKAIRVRIDPYTVKRGYKGRFKGQYGSYKGFVWLDGTVSIKNPPEGVHFGKHKYCISETQNGWHIIHFNAGKNILGRIIEVERYLKEVGA